MRKNAEELSLQTIVVFLIVIIVLVIIIIVFKDQFSAIANHFSNLINGVTETKNPIDIANK